MRTPADRASPECLTRSLTGQRPVTDAGPGIVDRVAAMGPLDEAEDAFGRALVDHLEGLPGPDLLLESDDGTLRTADLQPRDFFAPAPEWTPWERLLVGMANGRVLDLGAGAGRHALHLQELGHDVTAIDVSPGAVSACRARGVRDVRCADLRGPLDDGSWNTVLLMCGNLGLAGDWGPTRVLLERLARMTAPDGLLIGDTVDPTSEDPDDVAYEERNERMGFHRGHVRLRLRYRELVTPWWDQLNIAPAEIQGLVEGTGWSLRERAGDDEGYGVVLAKTL
jgi:SAM-dependent methyltransferase